MSNAIDIGKPLREITQALGLDHDAVGELTITPRTVEAMVYLKNDEGSKFCVPGTSVVASEVLEFDVLTGDPDV